MSPNFGLILPSYMGEEDGKCTSEEEPEFRMEGLKEEVSIVGTIGEVVCEEERLTPEQLAAAELVAVEDLDDGSFWLLLARAGYTSW